MLEDAVNAAPVVDVVVTRLAIVAVVRLCTLARNARSGLCAVGLSSRICRGWPSAAISPTIVPKLLRLLLVMLLALRIVVSAAAPPSGDRRSLSWIATSVAPSPGSLLFCNGTARASMREIANRIGLATPRG